MSSTPETIPPHRPRKQNNVFESLPTDTLSVWEMDYPHLNLDNSPTQTTADFNQNATFPTDDGLPLHNIEIEDSEDEEVIESSSLLTYMWVLFGLGSLLYFMNWLLGLFA